jgi:hypothetical protein
MQIAIDAHQIGGRQNSFRNSENWRGMEETTLPETVTRMSAALSWERVTLYIVIACLALCYAALAMKYRAYDIDSPWFQSHSYNLWNDHIDIDTFMNGSFPAGMGGTRVFGKLASLIQATVLNHLGWSQRNGAILSSTFVLSALAFWSCFLINIGLPRIQASLYILSLGLLEPFVSMACKSRWEFLSFFVLALSLWLASKRQEFPAILLSFLAVETQPIGVVVPLVTLIFLLRRQARKSSVLLYFLVASVVSAAVYILIHPLALTTIIHADWRRGAGNRIVGGFITGYFFVRKRHLPELGLLLLAGVLYWKRRKAIKDHFAVSASLAVILVACIFQHNNPAYMVFLYPFLLLAVWKLLATKRLSAIVTAVVALLVLPQYGILMFHINRHEGYDNRDIDSVKRAIITAQATMHLPNDQVRIYGDYGLWFSHPHNYVAADVSTRNSIAKSNVVLCYPAPIQSAALTQPGLLYCPDILRLGSYRELYIRA